jgi:hypothetical protein
MLLQTLRSAKDDDGNPQPVPCIYLDLFKFPDRSLRRPFVKRMRTELAGRHDDEDVHVERSWTRYAPPKGDLGYLIIVFVAVLTL